MRKSSRPNSMILPVILLVCRPLSCLEWPTGNPRIVETFGSVRAGSLSTGISITDSGPVRAIEAGELVFEQDGGFHPFGMPRPLGVMRALLLSRGLLAVYSNMDSGPPKGPDGEEAEQGAILGRSGTSGWSGYPGLVLRIMDRASRTWVNPVLLLPAIVQAAPLRIAKVSLSGSEGTMDPDSRGILVQGRYRIAVAVTTASRNVSERVLPAPYIVRLELDGVEIFRRVFDRIHWDGGRRSIPDVQAVSFPGTTGSGHGYELGEVVLNRGSVALTVALENLQGTMDRRTYRIEVR